MRVAWTPQLRKPKREIPAEGWVEYHCARCDRRSTVTRAYHLEHVGWSWLDGQCYCRGCAILVRTPEMNRTVPE